MFDFPDGSASGEGEASGDERASPAALALPVPRAPHAVSAASAATAAVLVSLLANTHGAAPVSPFLSLLSPSLPLSSPLRYQIP